MHLALQKDNPDQFTCVWFAWVITIFGELALKTFNQHRRLLNWKKFLPAFLYYFRLKICFIAMS